MTKQMNEIRKILENNYKFNKKEKDEEIYFSDIRYDFEKAEKQIKKLMRKHLEELLSRKNIFYHKCVRNGVVPRYLIKTKIKELLK